MTSTVSLMLSLLVALPKELTAIANAYGTVRSVLSAPDRAAIEAILAALDTKTDQDVAALNRDALVAATTTAG